MQGFLIKQFEVNKQLAQMSEPDRETALEIYLITDKIQNLKNAPYMYGCLFSLVLLMILHVFDLRLHFFQAEKSIMLILEMLICCMICIFACKYIYFERQRKKKISDLQTLLISNNKYACMFDRLLKIDPFLQKTTY